MDDVAARAQVSKGTVYLYFESKEEILAHLLLEGLHLLLEGMKAGEQEAAHLTPEDRLRAVAMAYFRFFEEQPSYFRLIMAFDRGRFEESISSTLYRRVLNYSLRGLSLLSQIIETGKQEGAFVVEDSWEAAGSVWAAINGVLVLMGHPLRQRLLRSDLDTMFQATLDLVIRGLDNSKGEGQT
jgi:TetR/AcrR family transcriptional regulator